MLQLVLIAPIVVYHSRCSVAADIESAFDTVVPHHLHTNDHDDPKPTALIDPWMLRSFFCRNANQIPEAKSLGFHDTDTIGDQRSQFVFAERRPVHVATSSAERWY